MGERMAISSLVLYEFLRGPRDADQIALQNSLFPIEDLILFGAREAEVSATLYRAVGRARGREIDLAIAACAIVRDAALWTLNVKDFSDIPGLRLAGTPKG
jgi:predicted nucleic acid-binding protein